MEKQQAPKDWHSKDIIAAVHKTGTSFQRMSRLNGYCANTLTQCLIKPYPKCERIIAAHLNTTPQTIWPSRYNQDGTPKSGRGQRGLGRHASNLKAGVYKDDFIHQDKNAGNVNDVVAVKQELAA